MRKFLLVFVVFVLAFGSVSEAKPINFSIKVNYGTPDDKGGCKQEFGICSIIISLKTVGASVDQGSQTLEVKGEIINNMLVVNSPFAIKENGRNAKGAFAFTISKETPVDPALAKELGVEKLSLLPGQYEFKGNTLALKISAPRDMSTGQSSGKSVLPTVNKKNIAIDEPGVQKTSTPGATYDVKANKK
jgi:hypothetical protein